VLPLPDKPSIAVLPFLNMSGDPEQEYFSDGITEDIITELSRFSTLFVIARNSSFTYKGQATKVQDIGTELGVQYVVEGSIRKAGNRVRVTAQLIDATTGAHVWAERYDRDLEDIFALQDEIVMRVFAELAVNLTEGDRARTLSRDTNNLKSWLLGKEAYSEYLKFTREGNLRARELWRAALELDPNMSSPLAGMAFTHHFDARRGWSADRAASVRLGIELAERAIEIDPEYALAHCGLADCFSFHYLWYEQRQEFLDGAERASKRAVELSPELAEAHASRGLAFSWCEDCADAAETHFETALRLNPRLFEAYYFFARDCLARGRLEKAARLFERAVEVRPEDYQAALLLPQVYVALGLDKKAEQASQRGLEIAERHLQLNPDDVRALYLSAGSWIKAGDRERGLRLARHALKLEPDEPTVLFNSACTFAQAGLIDEALDHLELGLNRGFGHRSWIEHDSDLDPIRDEPRFKSLMERLADRV